MAKSPWQCAFLQGYVCAVANIIRSNGEPSLARDVLKLAGNIRANSLFLNKGDVEVLRHAGLLQPKKSRSVSASKDGSSPE